MKYSTRRHVIALSVALVVTSLTSACDWVDSTGNQSADTPVTEIFLDDIRVGETIVILEQSLYSLTTRRKDASGRALEFSWSSQPIAQGKLDECADQNGFLPSLAVDTLQQACPSGETCALEFEPVSVDADDDLARFSLRLPSVDASVGLRYQLDITDSSSTVSSSEHSFCLIAVNEAPIANPDTFSITEGAVLNVLAGEESMNLLSNDSDDDDVSNTEFVILTEPLRGPVNAVVFELGDDGSFTYQSGFTGLREDQFDSFEYQLSDGVHRSTAEVTIRVVASNQAPRLLTDIPVVEATEGEQLNVDIAGNFFDPEEGNMTFSLSTLTPLALGSGLAMSQAGVLFGTPTAADVGSYSLSVIVSDGGLTTQAPLTIEIAPAPVTVANRAPVFVRNTVFGQRVEEGDLIRPVRAQFTDADGDQLTYSMAVNGSLPTGVSINRINGVITGRPSEEGVFSGLRVKATDSFGAFALSTAFFLTVVDD